MKKTLLIIALGVGLLTPTLTSADTIPLHGNIGILPAALIPTTGEQFGRAEVWNTEEYLNVRVTPPEGYLLSKVYMYLSNIPAPPAPPPDLTDEEKDPLWVEPNFGEWPYTAKFKTPTATPYQKQIPLADLTYLQWRGGVPWLQLRTVYVAMCVELKSTDVVPITFTVWAVNPNFPPEIQKTLWGENTYSFAYELQHPKHGQFAGPVHGLGYTTPTHTGITAPIVYFPGERVEFWIGQVPIGGTTAEMNIVSPVELFPSAEIDDPEVVNLARLLLTLDANEVPVPEVEETITEPVDNPHGAVEITESAPLLAAAMKMLSILTLNFADTLQMDSIIAKILKLNNGALPLVAASAEDASAWLHMTLGNAPMRRNVSKPHGLPATPPLLTDKPKMEIMPIWVTAKRADGSATSVEYKNSAGTVVEVRNKVKPLLVTYMQEREPGPNTKRRASDIYTAISLDDGSTWKKFNVSKMAWHSSFTLPNGDKFPGDCRSPQMKVAATNILVVWTSAYARGGKPAVSIKTGDDYPYDDPYAVRDLWGVRGRQGSVNYDLDQDVGDQGIGVVPYYALWACRGVLVWAGNIAEFPGYAEGEIVWFKPERLTTGRRDAFLPVVGAANGVGFGLAWQEDPGGLRPGQCMAGGHGWSGATVHKKTDIWYSFLKWGDFAKIDTNWQPMGGHMDEHGEEPADGEGPHSGDPDVVKRPKWLVPMSLPVRVSDNNTVNTDNMKVELNEYGLPVVDPLTGTFIPLLGAEEEDWIRSEHEHDEECGSGDVTIVTEDEEHDGEGGSGGGWGMARYAYMENLWKDPATGNTYPVADASGSATVWDASVLGDYIPTPGVRWYRFVNQPGEVKTVAVTPDGRVLDGDTGACRPNLNIMPGGWAILAYEETKGLGEPPDGEDHHELETLEPDVVSPDMDDSEINEKGKDVIYHSFKFDKPDMVSAGNVVNLPALDPATAELIPIYYKDSAGIDTTVLRQYATENARRVRLLPQSVKEMLTGTSRTAMIVLYKQGREGNGKPSDVFAVRVVVPDTVDYKNYPQLLQTVNPYRFSNFVRYYDGTKTVADTTTPAVIKGGRKHLNMSSVTVESIDPMDMALDHEGNYFGKVAAWKQEPGNISDESFSNSYSDAKGHRGFITGDTVVIGYSFTPNWGRKGGDHSDFYVRRSFTGGQDWTTDPKSTTDTVHTVIKRDPLMRGVYYEVTEKYGPGQSEPARNVSMLKGNNHTVGDPRLVEPMGAYVVNKDHAPAGSTDDTSADGIYYIAYGKQKVLHGQIGAPFVTDLVAEDIYYTRTTDGGTTWLMVPWVINPNSGSLAAGETVYRFPPLAWGSPYQGHAQLKMHPSGSRLYAIWHQWTDEYSEHVSPHEAGNDIWFSRIDFMDEP